jgi:RNA polymerase sigma-70 factor (ECF subfamily)
MASTFEFLSGFANSFPAETGGEYSLFQQIYEENRHRIYAISFWMTDNELTAEELMKRTLERAFSGPEVPSPELLDEMLIAELRRLSPLGALTLNCAACNEVIGVRRNTLRVHLERAVVQLPATERLLFLLHDVEGYEHDRIGRLMCLSEEQCQRGLHQARLRLRELLATMVN